MFSKITVLIESFHASSRVASALNSGQKPKAKDLRKLGVDEDHFKGNFL